MTSHQPDSSLSRTPEIREHAGDFLSRYDVLFCDVWGVVHNGLKAYERATRALMTFRDKGGTVILVSNAPVPKHRVAAMLETREVPTDAWDDIVSSGALALSYVAAEKFAKVYCIGPQDRDEAFFKALTARSTSLADAEAIVCTGLNDDRREAPEDYLPVLAEAHALGIPFVCANPDLIVDVGGTLLYCAGAIADLYQQMGGKVHWAGKPFVTAYETAHRRAEALRGSAVDISRTLVIGDALRTDIKGAANYGCDSIFISGGIHRHETMDGAHISPEKLAQLFEGDAPRATIAMAELAW